jgi:hypothetical protein
VPVAESRRGKARTDAATGTGNLRQWILNLEEQ